MTEYTFTISYYSEVTLVITMEYTDDGRICARCRHPMTTDPTYEEIPLGESWYFFSGPECEDSVMTFVGDSVQAVLDAIASQMYEGTEFYFGGPVSVDAENWFRQHLYIACAVGRFTQEWMHQRIQVVDRNV